MFSACKMETIFYIKLNIFNELLKLSDGEVTKCMALLDNPC